MKKNMLIATLLMTMVFSVTLVPAASAQDCNVPNSIAGLIQKLREECKKLEGAQANNSTCTSKRSTFLKLVDAWNSIVSGSSLQIGPRDMQWNTPQTGNLLAPADRRFISQLIEKDKGVTISVKKSGDGKADCVVNICSVDLDTGAETKLSSDTIDGNAAVGTEVKKSFSSAQVGNKIIIVRLDGKGAAKRFPYTFTASKN